MIGRFSLAIVIGLLSVQALAQEAPPGSQWRDTKMSLFDLVSSGARIVAITSRDSAGPTYTESYFLQKDTTMYRCLDVNTKVYDRNRSIFVCQELVAPYKIK
jgi:hypothetical protein